MLGAMLRLLRSVQVVLGGGRRHFVPKVTLDPEEPDKEGRRLDGRNLIEEWSRNHRLRSIPARYVANKEQFENVDPRKVNRLLGNYFGILCRPAPSINV